MVNSQNMKHSQGKQAEKLKSREMMKEEWRMMKDDDFKLLRGSADW